MFGQFLAQGIAIDAQHVSRTGLVIFGFAHVDGQQLLLHPRQPYVVHAGWRFAIELIVVSFQRIRDGRRNRILSFSHTKYRSYRFPVLLFSIEPITGPYCVSPRR